MPSTSHEHETVDPRVAAVLAVLAGGQNAEVARAYSVDAAVLHRWVRGFVRSGTAAVTNRPDAEAARERDRFLAAFAHELRTPLAIAKGWSSVVSDEDVQADELVEAAGRIEVALDAMTERIIDVELLAAACLGQVRLTPELVQVQELVAGLPGIGVIGGLGPEIEIEVDRDLFRRALRDMWTAAALAPVPRSRSMEVHRVGPWLELRVVRAADPIDPLVLQALFEPFERNADDTGVTIGLYLARALTVAHGGTVGLEQDEEHAVLWLRIPLPTSLADEPLDATHNTQLETP